MADAYIGEIRMFGGGYAPQNWMMCDGQQLSIAAYSSLYTVIGNTYGGDGVTTFALPDLRGRVPIHPGPGYVQGKIGGTESVALNTTQIPPHSHTPIASAAAGQKTPTGNVWATLPLSAYQSDMSNTGKMNAAAIGVAGGSQPHDNMMPYLTVTFIICVEGAFPPH